MNLQNQIYGALYKLLNLPYQAVQGINNTASNVGNNMTQLAQNMHLAPPNPTPIPQSQQFTQQQTNTPGFFQWDRANQGNLQNMNANQIYNMYQGAVNSPGGHPYGTNATPVAMNTPSLTPKPTTMPINQQTSKPANQQAVLGSQTSPANMLTQIPGLSPEQSQQFINNISQAFPVTRQYGIPDAVVAGQAALESANGQSPAGTYNFWGLKSNSHPGFANFNNIQQAAQYYAQTIANLVPNYKNMSPSQLITSLQGHGVSGNYDAPSPSDKGDPYTYSRKVMDTGAWKAFGGD